MKAIAVYRMRSLVFTVLLLFSLAVAQEGTAEKPKDAPSGGETEEGEAPPFRFVSGPTTVKIGDQAEIDVPEDCFFVDKEDVSKFLEWTGNLPSDAYLGMLAKKDLDWWVLYSFDSIGYVKDDEKESLDKAAMLESIKESVARSNEQRKQRGLDTLEVVDWVVAPHYDEATNNLEWSFLLRAADGGQTINHNTRFLGRYGVMEVELVAGDDAFQGTLSAFNAVHKTYHYSGSNTYASWVQGDKVAEYGLTALVVGGAAAVAAKGGLFKSLWKILVFAALGLAGLVKKLFGWRKREDAPGEPIS